MKIGNTVCIVKVCDNILYAFLVLIFDVHAALKAFSNRNNRKTHIKRAADYLSAYSGVSDMAGVDYNSVCERSVKHFVDRGLRIAFADTLVKARIAIIYEKTAVSLGKFFVKNIDKSIAFPVMNTAGHQGNYFIFSNHTEHSEYLNILITAFHYYYKAFGF